MPVGRRLTTVSRLHQALVNPVYAKKYSQASFPGQKAQRALALKCLFAISGGSQAEMDLLLQDLASTKGAAGRAEHRMVKQACVIFESIAAGRSPSLNAARRGILKVILTQVVAVKKKATLEYLKDELEMHSLSKEM